MTYRTFKDQCRTGTAVVHKNRTGTVIKISQDHEKALVRFSDGMTEWIEYYKIEIA